MTEVMTGRIDFYFVAASAAVANVRDGKLSALAVNGNMRSTALPDVPTMSEAGFRGAEYPSWYGLFAPAKTPKEIVERLYFETISALKQSNLKEKLVALGVDPLELSSAEFGALVNQDIERDRKLVQDLGLKPN